MSEGKRGRKRKPAVEASKDTVVYIPKMGFVKAGELKAKLAKEVKVTPTPLIELEKAVVAKVVEKEGKVSRSGLNEILRAVKQERGTKRGVTLSRLIADGFLARIKVPSMRAFYAATEKGAKEAGIVK